MNTTLHLAISSTKVQFPPSSEIGKSYKLLADQRFLVCYKATRTKNQKEVKIFRICLNAIAHLFNKESNLI